MESNLHKNVTEQKIIPEIRFEADKNTYALRNIAQIDGNYEKKHARFYCISKVTKRVHPMADQELGMCEVNYAGSVFQSHLSDLCGQGRYQI